MKNPEAGPPDPCRSFIACRLEIALEADDAAKCIVIATITIKLGVVYFRRDREARNQFVG